MSEQTLEENTKPAGSFGVAIGLDEILYLAGLALLTAGSFLAFSWAGAMISSGVTLLITSLVNKAQE